MYRIMLKFKKLIAPISYQGSKRRELKKIEEYEPKKFEIFVDVFGGGGSVSINYMKKNKKVIYNDINIGLTELFKTLKDENKTKELLEEMDKIDNTNIEVFYKIFDREYKISEVARLLYLTKISFRNMIYNRMPIQDKVNGELKLRKQNIKFKNLIKFNELLKQDTFEVYNKNFYDILNKYKTNQNAFLYLDPPYISKKNNEYDKLFVVKDLINIRDFIEDKDTKCKVMLNIDYTGYTRELFNKTFKHGYSVKYISGKVNEDIYGKYHLIATNYTWNDKSF